MKNILEIDKKHIWHPYNSLPTKTPILAVKKTKNCKIYLEDGRVLIDSMSSWWSAILGYNNKDIYKSIKKQAKIMPHVMFGGLTHKPAVKLAKSLVKMTGYPSLFLCDSGSVSVEVALKTAILYQKSKGKEKTKFIALKNSYHGDTLGAMSVCDPENSMHSLYGDYLSQNIFVETPNLGFEADYSFAIKDLENKLEKYHEQVAAFIVEPVVQGAGGMRIYNPKYLNEAKKLCEKYGVLLIFDEVATGFGHTGKLFAFMHTDIRPDILTIGKALTGGTLTMAAMLTKKEISDTISNSSIGVLMHGPTFMANPLACSVANAAIKAFTKINWEKRVKKIEKIFKEELEVLKDNNFVKDVRVIGSIGVVELKDNIYAAKLQDFCVQNGIWIRPFGKLFYSIVSYTIKEKELKKICKTMVKAIYSLEKKS
ncbi:MULTISPECIES: adenosylmethionine--8-amino-7-oxononanoate transaminase [Arcobacteraceae]|uniref:Adenosylmethionine-8-amino-7-oxononanoate aminotransferase n=3 Tax=Arcobacteraceae TaxID=2808963 RepID=A0A1C0B7Z4_9BACT|nr:MULTISPECIES: adenosylmethionine--8-amino-7-oxononanoate transaminase [Arcobacteraceae]OCL94060.1 Adenosylmethionine-8-amino-7-oxononanoate aminotransferase [Aliarcobacter thereius]OCL95454.1 Adenosylmethionine-8-amino-7-oxononanoate aminotransferase [Aliarcobacter thereius LMG 24486]OCL96554.1 Adenosylmethionine-8-amino-7-oxononanoate aminotransferase [Aliarcobacter thereius]OCL99652.1 Adenosylmethionine-8-amino-7-oxononanoate aminotransferase [Aliarcobacter thereius]QBF16558.1 adenosylmet